MEKQIKILYLEDNPFDAGLTKHTLKRSEIKFELLMVETEKEFIAALTGFSPDIVLSDHSLPGFNSTEAFKILLDKKPGTPFILLTGSMSGQLAADYILEGIDDYILKSDMSRLPSSIERILANKK